MNTYYFYIMASIREVLYIGITNNLERRVNEHKSGLINGFTKKYNCKRLIYFEESNDVNAIIAREKQVKKWGRQKKIDLINRVNPTWTDLSTSSR